MATVDERFNPAIANALERDGYAECADFLAPVLWHGLAGECRALEAAGALAPAAIGRGATRGQSPTIRGDHTAWLDGASTAQRALLDTLDAIRLELNQTLLLNLAEVEAHFARYAPGTRYARHRDAFRDDASRVVSCVLYLNADWRAGDGGALRIHLPDGATRDVAPRGGRAVFFLSAEFEHEVLPATRERLSIAAWFRRRV